MIQKVNNIFKKYFTQKVRNIISIFIIIFGLTFIINYSFFRPTYINKLIASNMYKSGINSNFTDAEFYYCVIEGYNDSHSDVAYTTNLSDAQLADITSLDCSNIDNADGLELLTNLERLVIRRSHMLDLDLSINSRLSYVYITDTDLTSDFSIANNPRLTDLTLFNNNFSNLDVSHNTALTYLNYSFNNVSDFDVSNNTALEYLLLRGNKLDSDTLIGLDKLTELTSLDLSLNEFVSLDVKKNTKLDTLRVSSDSTEYSQYDLLYGDDTSLHRNMLSEIDLTANKYLKFLDLSYNDLAEIDLSKNTKLTRLIVKGNHLKKLDLSHNTKIWNLQVSENELTSLDLSMLNELSLDYDDLAYNDFHNVLTKYVWDNNEDRHANTSVKLPSGYDNEVIWESADPSIAFCDDEGHVVGINVGQVDLIGTNEYYTTRTIFNSFNVYSESGKYTIAENGNAIFVGNKKDADILQVVGDIRFPEFIEEGQITKELSADYTELSLIKNNTVLKKMAITSITTNEKDYTFGDGYVFVGIGNNPDDNVTCNNCTLAVDNNKLIIKYNNEVIYWYDIVRINTSYTLYRFDDEDSFIYVADDEKNLILDKFKVTKGTVSFDPENTNKLVIKYGDEILKSFDIKQLILSDDSHYILGSNYIFTGFEELTLDENNKNENIGFNVSGLGLAKDDYFGKLHITMDGVGYSIVKYNILTLINNGIDYDETAGKIYVDAGTTVSQLKNKIGKYGSFDAKVFRDNKEIKTGIIEDDMTYRIYVDGETEAIKTYILDASSYYVDFTGYDVKNGYIFLTGDSEIDVDNISVRNCTLRLTQDKLEVIQDGSVVENYKIVKITGPFVFLKNYIYVGAASNTDILINVNIPKELKKDIVDNKLRILSNGTELWKKPLIKLQVGSELCSGCLINEEGKTIFTSRNEPSSSLIGAEGIHLSPSTYGTLTFDTPAGGVPMLKITFSNDNINDLGYKMYGYDSGTYDLDNKYLYLGYSQNGNVNINAITPYNVSFRLSDNNNKLEVVSPNNDDSTVYYEYDILYYNFNDDSGIMRVAGDKIYASSFTDYEIINKFNFNNEKMSAVINGNKVTIKYGAASIDEIDLIRVSCGKAGNCVDGVIFTYGRTGNDLYENNVIVYNGYKNVGNGEVIIKETEDSEEKLEKFKTLELFTFDDDIAPSGNKIVLSNPMLYEAFMSKIHKYSSSIPVNVYNGETLVTSGSVTPGMKLVITVSDKTVTFNIVSESIIFSKSLNFDKDDNVIYNVLPGTSIFSISNLIDTPGTITVYDGETIVNDVNTFVKTGYTFKIQLTNNLYTYPVYVMGDVLGTGELSIENAKEIARYIIKRDKFDDNELINEYKFKAADFDLDGFVKMNDVVKIVRAINENND